jgi:hypothetical protein
MVELGLLDLGLIMDLAQLNTRTGSGVVTYLGWGFLRAGVVVKEALAHSARGLFAYRL